MRRAGAIPARPRPGRGRMQVFGRRPGASTTRTSKSTACARCGAVGPGKSLDGASFQILPELIAHIEAFVDDYNEAARPFV
ncbi:MAG: hypothetical protein C3F11_04855 [Methylocystaceae bacterium]|nr:MAG: hypothetical protein C3F11_04855 [Methylocystaceae bacterium]